MFSHLRAIRTIEKDKKILSKQKDNQQNQWMLPQNKQLQGGMSMCTKTQ